jgi:potassium efflux system protein
MLSDFYNYLSIIMNYVSYFWHASLLKLDGKIIHVGNVIIALFMIFVALKYIAKFKTYLENKLEVYFQDDKHTHYLISNMIFYIICFLYFLGILQIANIPISIFAFVGGALALGVGLGTQNIINNFISGIILMIEKPIKISDQIEIDAASGDVIAIGYRYTTILTGDNKEIFIPNSKVLDGTLINYTHQNSIIRSSINITIEITSDHNLAINIIKEILNDKSIKRGADIYNVYITNISELGVNIDVLYKFDLHVISARSIKHIILDKIITLYKESDIKFSIRSK